MKITDNKIKPLHRGTCNSLSGRSELEFEYVYDERSKTILFRVVKNSGSGHFSTAYVKLDDILKCLETAKEPFSLSVFKSLYPGQSLNNLGFLGAVLTAENLIVCEKRQYIRKDSKAFVADLNKLIKPTPKKKPATKKS